MSDNDIEKGVRDIANFMAVAAKTAPKARGIDNIEILIVAGDGLDDLADKMVSTGKTTERAATFQRDSGSVRGSSAVVIIGTKAKSLGLDCGFCGQPSCEQAEADNITCAFNSGDLGIAVGSAVAAASRFHLDNRIMYTIGYTAIKTGLMKGVRMALGIPLSATGKNPFFDRG